MGGERDNEQSKEGYLTRVSGFESPQTNVFGVVETDSERR